MLGGLEITKTLKITEMASVIRSKNSGPYELTFDIIFKDRANFQLAKSSGIFTKKLFASLYGIEPESVLNVVAFEQANAVKATIVRPVVSGSPGDSDVYGAQQHAPLLDIKVPVNMTAVGK
jgi:hypothetical protein